MTLEPQGFQSMMTSSVTVRLTGGPYPIQINSEEISSSSTAKLLREMMLTCLITTPLSVSISLTWKGFLKEKSSQSEKSLSSLWRSPRPPETRSCLRCSNKPKPVLMSTRTRTLATNLRFYLMLLIWSTWSSSSTSIALFDSKESTWSPTTQPTIDSLSGSSLLLVTSLTFHWKLNSRIPLLKVTLTRLWPNRSLSIACLKT